MSGQQAPQNRQTLRANSSARQVQQEQDQVQNRNEELAQAESKQHHQSRLHRRLEMCVAQKSIFHKANDRCQLPIQIKMHEKAIQYTQPKEKGKENSNHGEDAALCDIKGLVHEVLAWKVHLGGQLDAICDKAADEDEEQSLCDFAVSLEMQEVIDV